ncbi:MAG: hypothetical protein LBS99_07335 [Clostridiales bacterium]|nr:hypothetical protein [Clostridiales bacterium]
MKELKINPKFRDIIPPLSGEEYADLRESIASEGCRDALIVWNGTIVDGHNRYGICKELGVPFNTFEKNFESEDDALLWIMRNQLARRNLCDVERGRLALKLKEKISERAKESQGARTDILPNLAKCEAIDTREELAKIAGLSHGTLAKIERVDKEAPAVIREAMGKTISIDRAARINGRLKRLPEGERGTEAERMLSPAFREELEEICREEKIIKKLQNIFASATLDFDYISEECVDVYIRKSCESVSSVVETIDDQIAGLEKLKRLFLAREKLFEEEKLWKIC